MNEVKIEEISLEEIEREVDFLKAYIKSLSTQKTLTPDQIKRISGIHNIVNRIKNLARESKVGEDELKTKISDCLFGSSGDKKSSRTKLHRVESLLHDVSDETITSLIDRYVDGNFSPDYIRIKDIISIGGICDVDETKGLNGIAGKDIKRVYNFDSEIGGGLQQRGRGESLFSIAFDSKKNNLPGGDVVLTKDDLPTLTEEGKVVEIKSSNNAGITPKTGDPISSDVVEILEKAGQTYQIEELLKGRIQKNSAKDLIDEVSKGDFKSRDFLEFLSSIAKVRPLGAQDILPVIFLLQLDYYSKQMKEFQVLAVFIETKGGPEKLVIIEADEDKGFVTENNIDVLIRSGVAPKITSSNRMEIYRFNKK